MKNELKAAIFSTSLLLIPSLGHTLEEIVVTGQRPDSPTVDLSSIGISALPVSGTAVYGTTMTQADKARKQAAEQEGRKQACFGKANAAKQQCENAYGDLNKICSAYLGYLGARGASWVFSKMVGGSAPLVEEAISKVSGTTGGVVAISFPEDMPGCKQLTASAMQYCAAGAEKMIKSCKK